MTGLILKDLLILRKTIKTYVLFLAVYTALAAIGFFPAAAAASVTQIIIMMLPVSAFSFDEYAKWDRYALTFPAGRRTVVKARYLFALTMAACGTLFNLLATLPLAAVRGAEALSLAEQLSTLLVSLGLGLVICDLLLPLCYKLGVERARPFLYLIVFLPAAAFFLLVRMDILDLSALNRMDPAAAMLAFAAFPAAALLGMVPSYLISRRIMERKEF